MSPMAARYYAVQGCFARGGWKTLPTLASRKEHEAIHLMEEVSAEQPRMVYRVQRMAHGWEPEGEEPNITTALRWITTQN